MIKQNRAITLIALIIMVIILLILAGVGISFIIGNNGLINKSKSSVGKYKDASDREQGLFNDYQGMMAINSENRDETNKSMYGIPSVTGTGTQEDPFIVKTGEQLFVFSGMVTAGKDFENMYIKLNNDIDLSTVCSQELNKSWYPIGSGDTQFKGTFDGNNHKITGLYINSSNQMQALFGKNSGIIKDLTVEGSVKTSNYYAAGICAYNYGDIQFCTNKCAIESEQMYIGGICGCNSGSILYCCNAGNIKAKAHTGGISGIGSGTSYIKECYNTASIITTGYDGSSNSNVGGILGWYAGATEVFNCYNRGSITISSRNAGGIVGCPYEQSVKIQNCYNTGALSGGYWVGSISGESNGATLTNNYATTSNSATGRNGSVVSGRVGLSDNELKNLASTLGSAYVSDGKKIDGEGNVVDNKDSNGNTIYINDGYPILRWQAERL